MNKKTSFIIVFLLLVAAFLGGVAFARVKDGKLFKTAKDKTTPQVTTAPQPTQAPFVPKQKSAKPEVKFFVMSFCPYGNQAEAGLEPVYQLLKDKVSWQPRYIVSQITQDSITQCKQSCAGRVGNEAAKKQCQDAITAGQVKDMDADTCVKTYFPYKTAEECITKTCNTLKVNSWESLHGVQELNQNVREICAYNLGNLDNWWKFITLTNSNCTSANVDTCWTEQAKSANLDTAKISTCEKSQKTALLVKENAESTKYQAQGSPTIYINETLYNGGRSPEDYKKAICASFENPPTECSQSLGAESAATSGGCAP